MPRAVPSGSPSTREQWATLRRARVGGGLVGDAASTVGDEIAPLIGAGAGEVAMVPNVSIAQAQVLSALDYGGGRDTIVMTELDFPSVRYVYDALAARLGARDRRRAERRWHRRDEERLIEAIDERTRLVAISHVLFRSA